MFRIHLPRRDWNTLQIVERATIKEVLRETETWLGEIVGGEHLIIEYADFVQTAGPNYAPLNSSVSREDEMKGGGQNQGGGGGGAGGGGQGRGMGQ